MAATLIAGSYERHLIGFTIPAVPKDADPSPSVPPLPLPISFSYSAHLGPVTAVATSGFTAASGGADDTVRLYDLKTKQDMGTLTQHEGTVTCLEFYGPQAHPTHLISGGEDSNICLWDADTWQHLITLNGHKAAVNDLSIHPTGRLALSVSRDNSLRMWNLVVGKSSFTKKLDQEAIHVAFAPKGGETYAVGSQGGTVSLHVSETGKEVRKLKHDARVLALALHLDSITLTAGDEAVIRVWDSRQENPVLSIPKAHKSRIRGLSVPPNGQETVLPLLLASASSDGVVRIWDPRKIQTGTEHGNGPVPWVEVETKARITCLAMGGFWKKKTAEVAKSSGVLLANLPKESEKAEHGKLNQKRKKGEKEKDEKDEKDTEEVLPSQKNLKKQETKNGGSFQQVVQPVEESEKRERMDDSSTRKKNKKRKKAGEVIGNKEIVAVDGKKEKEKEKEKKTENKEREKEGKGFQKGSGGLKSKKIGNVLTNKNQLVGDKRKGQDSVGQKKQKKGKL